MNALAHGAELALHAAREPGRDAGGAARRRADRRSARQPRGPSATAPRSRSARSSAPTRSTRRCFAPPPRRLPDAGSRRSQIPHARDQRDDAPAHDGGDALPRAGGRSPRWPRRWAPSAAGSPARIDELGGGPRRLARPRRRRRAELDAAVERDPRRGPSSRRRPTRPARASSAQLIEQRLVGTAARSRQTDASNAARAGV